MGTCLWLEYSTRTWMHARPNSILRKTGTFLWVQIVTEQICVGSEYNEESRRIFFRMTNPFFIAIPIRQWIRLRRTLRLSVAFSMWESPGMGCNTTYRRATPPSRTIVGQPLVGCRWWQGTSPCPTFFLTCRATPYRMPTNTP